MIKTFFFDLDSTLLQMNQDLFLQKYFASLKEFAATKNLDEKKFFYYLNLGVDAMLNNDGTQTNEAAFIAATKDFPILLEVLPTYYEEVFPNLKTVVKYNPLSNQIVKELKAKGYQIVLATNPLFPKFATLERMSWAGLDADLFSHITTYENSSYTKPKKEYFFEIMTKLGLTKEEVYYIGNDVDDDFKEIGNTFKAFIISDYLINKENKAIEIPMLSLEELYYWQKENV